MEGNYLGIGGGTIGILTFIVGILIKVNHKRCRSKCCGKNMEIAVDVEDTTPKGKDTSIKIAEQV